MLGCAPAKFKEVMHPYAEFSFKEFMAVKSIFENAYLKFDNRGNFEYSEDLWILPVFRYNQGEGQYQLVGDILYLNWNGNNPSKIHPSLSNQARVSKDGLTVEMLLPDGVSPCWKFIRK